MHHLARAYKNNTLIDNAEDLDINADLNSVRIESQLFNEIRKFPELL